MLVVYTQIFIIIFAFRGDFMSFFNYNENKIHGTASFPIEYYFVDFKHPQYVMPLHYHREFEFIKIISGNFNLFLDGNSYTLKAGDMAFIACQTLHQGEPENCVYECIVCDLTMLRRQNNNNINNLIISFIEKNYNLMLTIPPKDSEIYKTASEIFKVLSKEEEFFEFDVYSLLFELFGEFYKNGYIVKNFKNPQFSKKSVVMIKLLDWIEKNYTTSITLSDLAKLSGLSEKYVCKIFKEYTTKTPIDYINQLKIDFACYQLSATDKTITQIAYESGFNDLSYFSKTFKAYKNISPKKYKNSL